MAVHELRAKRATTFDAWKALGLKKDFDNVKDQPEFERLKGELATIDAEITRYNAILEDERKTALPVVGQEHRAYAAPKDDPWTNEAHAIARGLLTNKGLIVGAIAKMMAAGHGNYRNAREEAKEIYGESHPVTKALLAGTGSAGGFIVPPEYINEIIELQRPMAVVRSANPRMMPMPRGTMTLPAQTQAATASYGAESTAITASQPALGQIIASYKKLTALVPVGNDLLRYADPAADAFVRDDLVKVMALREDLAFIMGDGTVGTPRGFLQFANAFIAYVGGTTGVWSSTANSTLAVDATTGVTIGGSLVLGNFVTSNETYTLATAAAELGGLVNKLDTANVPDMRRCWFMHPRSYNYLYNVQNSLGLYVYRDELMTGKLLGYPVKKSTQIPINIWDATGTNKDCSFVFLVEMTDAIVLDSMQLELAVSREGAYVDSNSNQVNAFQSDQTIIRAIAEHDFQMRHDASIAVAQTVRWAPAIS